MRDGLNLNNPLVQQLLASQANSKTKLSSTPKLEVVKTLPKLKSVFKPKDA